MKQFRNDILFISFFLVCLTMYWPVCLRVTCYYISLLLYYQKKLQINKLIFFNRCYFRIMFNTLYEIAKQVGLIQLNKITFDEQSTLATTAFNSNVKLGCFVKQDIIIWACQNSFILPSLESATLCLLQNQHQYSLFMSFDYQDFISNIKYSPKIEYSSTRSQIS